MAQQVGKFERDEESIGRDVWHRIRGDDERNKTGVSATAVSCRLPPASTRSRSNFALPFAIGRKSYNSTALLR